MMNIIGTGRFRQQNVSRVCVSLQRLFAQAASSGKSPTGPPLIEDMPKITLPPEYKALVDIKQEPGYVIVNGRRYPYPYPGIHGEYNYLEMVEKWRSEGKLDKYDRPIFSKMKGREKYVAQQLWFQRDPTLPVWQLGKYDDFINRCFFLTMFFTAVFAIYTSYRLAVPKEQDVFVHDNWERWRKESHH